MNAKATKRAMATAKAMRMARNYKGDGHSHKGGKQATATRAMEAVTTVVGKDEGNGNSNEGGGQQGGQGQHGDGDSEKDDGRAMATATKKAVAIAMR